MIVILFMTGLRIQLVDMMSDKGIELLWSGDVKNTYAPKRVGRGGKEHHV